MDKAFQGEKLSEEIKNLVVTQEDIENENNLYAKALKTGFNDIDLNAPFLPGVILFGALPGMGKTTFALNVSANICESGTSVLYVSYEQSRMDFWYKDLSRYWFMKRYDAVAGGVHNTPTALELKRNLFNDKETFAKYRDELNQRRENFYFLRGHSEPAEILIKQIEPAVSSGVKFVVIDYIQLIPSNKNPKATAREQVDSAVRAFKEFQVETGITLFIISSFNRQSYYGDVGFDSFKETGGLEYSADLIFGMQFAKKADETRNREFHDKKIAETPREIELKCLKNRYGEIFRSKFSYFSRNDTFFERTRNSQDNQAQKKKFV